MNADEICNIYFQLHDNGKTPREILATFKDKGLLPTQVLTALNAEGSGARSADEVGKVCRYRDELLKEINPYS